MSTSPLTYATENIFMSRPHTAAPTFWYTCYATWEESLTLSGFSLMWLLEETDGEASGPLSKECRLSRRLASSVLQLVPHRLPKARLFMMLVFRASTDSSTVGLWFEPQCKWIAPHVLKGILIQLLGLQTVIPSLFQVSPHMLGGSSANKPLVCDRGGCFRVGLPSLRKIHLIVLMHWSNNLYEDCYH
jgi:hypothetical protein